VKGQAASGSNREGESTDAQRRDGAACSSDEGFVMKLERRGCVVQPRPRANWKREESVDEAKPFKIPKREVWEAFKRVKANQGTAGVDGQSIAEFEADLRNNLYKLWNRLSSGSYFPPPVLRVDIPKADGGTRPLGIPTVADRVAQEVARRYLEPILEPVFHTDSWSRRLLVAIPSSWIILRPTKSPACVRPSKQWARICDICRSIRRTSIRSNRASAK
jgi:RNA-directed DNA polymerase